ncbi:AAA family ATPase, partial [Paraglaciecola mesophila]|uniref:AAA family ATPase n=1 Tax=Paraglaciecola mesophila TaxID=197222 RepID=UPI001363A422
MFESIEIKNWRQFDSVKIDFHPNLTVITGANGAGKTTVLGMLSRHFGWNIQYASTPRKAKKGLVQYLSDFWSESSPKRLPQNKGQIEIGSISYKGH